MIKRLPAILLAFTAGIVFAYAVLSADPPPKAWAGYVFDARLMSADPALPIPSLTDIVGDAKTDEDAQTSIADYYDRQQPVLAVLFSETDDQRLRGLFGMYIVHLARPYNVVPEDWESWGLLDFLHGQSAHCGLYSLAQKHVYDALGLRWREVVVDGGWHGLIEAQIGANFEVFDSTTNVWIDQPVESLLDGVARNYRAFYSPMMDRTTSSVYRAHAIESGGYYDVYALREGLPRWGLTVHPGRVEIVAPVQAGD